MPSGASVLRSTWVEHEQEGGWYAIAGPDRYSLKTDVELYGKDPHTVGKFEVADGEGREFVLTHGRSFGGAPTPPEGAQALAATRAYWEAFTDRIRLPRQMRPAWRDAVQRSLGTATDAKGAYIHPERRHRGSSHDLAP